MSSYVGDWLNHEVCLSVHISVPSKQFSNGYYFGELLVALGWLQPSQFAEMRNSPTTNARLENFDVVASALRANGVNFNPKVSVPLMVTEARGAAADVLLKIKNRKAEQDNPPPKPPLPSTHSVRPKKFARGPMTDWGTDDFFLKTMENVGTHNFNKLDETIHLRKFHDSQREMEQQQTGREEADVTTGKMKTKMRIAEQLQMARDRAEFMNKMIEEGRKSWQVNEDKRIEFERQRLRFELATAATHEAKRENQRLVHSHDERTNIAGFERNMKRLGVGNDDTDDGEYKPSHESGLNYLQRLEVLVSEAKLVPEANYEAMENLKRTEKVNRRARKERETRRRKMLVDQRNASSELDKKEGYAAMMEGLAATSTKMRLEAKEKWEAKKRREIADGERDQKVEVHAAIRVENAEMVLKEFFAVSAKRSAGEEAKKEKEARLAEIENIKAAAKEKKRVTATLVSEAAVAKLLDLVEIMCSERVAVGGPVAPQFYRDLKKVYVSGQPYYEDEPKEPEEVWSMAEEFGGWAEGEEWRKGGALWGWQNLGVVDFVDKEELTTFKDADVEKGVKACLNSLYRDYISVADYMKWTKYEFASFLRREEDGWAKATKGHKKKILKMPTEDNTDLEEIEDAIDLLEEDLGDVAEERADASRDVCDGSSGRAFEWMKDVVAGRKAKMSELIEWVVKEADGKVQVLKKEPSLLIELGAEDSDEEVEEKKQDGVCEGEGEEGKEEKEEEETEETEEEREARLQQEEAILMGSEYEFEVSRLSEIERRKKLKRDATARLDASELAWTEVLSTDEFLSSKADGALEVKAELEWLQHHFLETDDIPAYFNAVAVTCGLTDRLIRIGFRLKTFSSKVEEVQLQLSSSLDRMCKKRAKVESDAIVEFASRIGAAASTKWKGLLVFAIDLSHDERTR